MAVKKVIVGMSGGVDSSVAALLLQQRGYVVEGLFMKNWDEDDGTEYCTAKEDLSDAEKICERLGIVLHTANFAVDYWDNVFEFFLREYAAGRTPNPDILCNREIKFKVFLDYAQILGADAIATGHYSRIDIGGGGARLLKGLDANKDQSYFLHAVPEQAFARSLFPLGELEKAEVRAIAAKHRFETSSKKDSTGICFIGERRFKDFLATYLAAQPGPIQTPEGRVLGEHQGLMFYTLGQRQGLGIGGVANSGSEPWYSLDKDLDNNILIVGQGAQHPALFTDRLCAEQVHWINGRPQQKRFDCHAKNRYRQADQACSVSVADDGGCTVAFAEPQRAVTPGQSVVFYNGEECLGGGIISRAWRDQ
jgi:tRNA-specific 2-thiouridylase